MKKSIISMERVKRVISELNPIDDLIFRKLAESRAFCEEILREFMQDPELEVIENYSQYSITNLERKSVILDAYCILKDGKRVDIEVQNLNDINHQKRVRYYSSVLTTNLVEKGSDFNSVPDICMIYICNFDLFKANKSLYTVKRSIDGINIKLDNGLEEKYISANINDGSSLSELMEVFTKSEFYSSKFPVISEMKYRLKYGEKGEGMTEALKELYEDLRKEVDVVELDRARESGIVSTLVSLVKDGILSIDEAAKRAKMSVDKFEKYVK
ncbi:PD-(D/E)XK nuclease family transposase [Lachnoanaerobaculum sp. MSX33]|uniref:Rpn family recombination-promoting nuclease/putative transposase n=1 Tax=Lachnoanaerobaculum sp. MSX33 TaxID=936596 RepID=UPI0003DFA4F7|nr:Rpn family recombination-promoting nuclease/putative transposase [Lachnoanaerobaculum sp. MSX33]ETO99253.1 PD-(D/E)XK nuclease family transposase [Lachnoanaerobaculum sp. MSX33]